MATDLNTLLTTWIADQYSGQSKHGDGTAAAPALTFTNDLDTGLYKAAANTVGIAAAGAGAATVTTNALSLLGGSGGKITLGTATELVSIAAAATTDSTASLLPANSIILGVSCKCTAVPSTAVTFTVIGATSSTAFQTGSSVAFNTGATGEDAGTKSCPYLNVTAQKVRITPNAQPGNTAGRVRLNVYYLTVTPPTA